MEILTVNEVAALLRVSKRHVFELAQPRYKSGDIRKDPLPCIRLGKSVRFIREQVEKWIERLSANNKCTQIPKQNTV
jgi:predicted DNA-binding transcriptional regulator AlpA